jgi:hypothetical protein
MGKKKKGRGKPQPAAPAARPGQESGPAPPPLSAPNERAAVASGEVGWPEDVPGQRRLLALLKYQTLGPFLFSQKTLSVEVGALPGPG